ncbi:MAG: sigma-70 family RNA polymerase sigma factor [Thermoanaerobaculia bacterium]|nr:sigma-70 family RNA polymerase sigma factor [Thermoanaerobaculia bacterium]
MTDENSSDLALRARAGDQEAFGQLCLRHWSGLVALARSVLIDDAEAEDAVQDSLVHAWKKLPALRDPAAFSPWLKKSLLRDCIRRAKRRKKKVELSDLEIAGPPNQSNVDVPGALRTLSPRQRAVLFLGEVQGLEDREIANLLRLRPSTVRVHRARARERLQELLGDTS